MEDSTIEKGQCVNNNDYEPVSRSFIDKRKPLVSETLPARGAP
jgi:hypothetical protein